MCLVRNSVIKRSGIFSLHPERFKNIDNKLLLYYFIMLQFVNVFVGFILFSFDHSSFPLSNFTILLCRSLGIADLLLFLMKIFRLTFCQLSCLYSLFYSLILFNLSLVYFRSFILSRSYN